MSGLKHTPGPWVCDDFLSMGGHRNRIGTELRFGQIHTSATIAFTQQNWKDADTNMRRISWAEAVANALLISKSPELLINLIKAEAFISGFEGDPLQEGIDQLLTEIRTTIAAATGAAGTTSAKASSSAPSPRLKTT